MSKFPILIPSKGRPSCPTAKLLEEGGRSEFRIIVEPQDAEAYAKAWGERLIILPKSNQGIAYVRQFALELECDKIESDGWYWMLDDDIQGFYEVGGGRVEKTDADTCLTEAEGIILRHNATGDLAIAALEYQQFAWGAKRSVIENGYCDVAVAINKELGWMFEYDQRLRMKEDRDFALSVIAAGFRTLRTTRYAFGAPKNGSNAGGLAEEYAEAGKELADVQLMVSKWGKEVCEHIVKPDGRHDCRIDWSALKGRA